MHFGQGEDVAVLIETLRDGDVVRVGREDADGFFTHGGLEIDAVGVWAAVENPEGQGGELLGTLTLDEVRRAHTLLGAYLAMVDVSSEKDA
jgi:hypothetical protein